MEREEVKNDDNSRDAQLNRIALNELKLMSLQLFITVQKEHYEQYEKAGLLEEYKYLLAGGFVEELVCEGSKKSQNLKRIMKSLQYEREVNDMAKGIARELEEYYTSDLWKQDFADDEAGLLPKDLKRGVLSEDGIWNVLEEFKQITF